MPTSERLRRFRKKHPGYSKAWYKAHLKDCRKKGRDYMREVRKDPAAWAKKLLQARNWYAKTHRTVKTIVGRKDYQKTKAKNIDKSLDALFKKRP